MNIILKKKIKQAVVAFIVLIATIITITVMVAYNVNGETNMEFNISQMLIVSSADCDKVEYLPRESVAEDQTEAEQNAEQLGENVEQVTENTEQYRWEYSLNQYNDIYIYFEKNENNKEATAAKIKSVTINNFRFETEPNISNVKVIAPNPEGNTRFVYNENYFKNSITYTGTNADNFAKYEINENGGVVAFRIANLEFADLRSNDDEIKKDGTLITKTDTNYEDLKFKIKFDVSIDIGDKNYKGTVTLDLPNGNIAEEGISSVNEKDFSDIIFKR